MSSVKRDYYELLGVPHDADADTICEAFRAAARDCDPADGASPEAELRFRELKEAYGVLSRPGPRLLYDRHGYRARSRTDFDQLLPEAGEPTHGEDVNAPLALRRLETSEGTKRLVTFEVAETCSACDGSGRTGGPCGHCGGSGRVDVLRRLLVRIPPGVETGEQLRVTGEGNAAPRGGVPGNLLLDVTVVPEPRESRVVRYVAALLVLTAVAVLYVYLH